MSFKLVFFKLKIFLSKIKKVINSKILFSKIKRKDILIWGTPGFTYILNEKKYKFLDLKKANVIKIWGESYHFLILLKCFLKLKFSLVDYTNEYIKIAQPKIIISFLDNYSSFYFIKKNKSQKKILIQNATRTNEDDTFKLEKSYLKYKVDYVFCHNNQIKREYEKLLNSMAINTGSFLSNNFPINNADKKYDILYVSTFRKTNENIIKNGKITWGDYISSEKKLVKNIFNFAKKFNKKLFILCTNKVAQKTEEELFFTQTLGKNNNWKFAKRKYGNFKQTYEIVDQSNIVVGIDSTLLYESFGRGSKTIFFDIRPSNKYLDKTRHFGWPKKFSKIGPFWTSYNDYSFIKNILLEVISLKKSRWMEIQKKYVDDLMNYEKNNKTFIKILEKHLSK
tara:strand:- start:11756 stop:12940 length:1185 start_codon:yes stop_codon:yes gene_type:complete